MIAYFILGLALLFGVFLLARWFAESDPKTVARVVRWTLVVLAGGVVLFVVLAARQYIFAILLPLLLFLFRNRGLLKYLKSLGGPTPGRSSTVETRFLRMTLDHDSGQMTGVVREGPYQGAELGQLTLEQLVELWRACRADDAQSAAVLEAYLDRAHPDDWRAAAGIGAGAGAGSDGSGQRAAAEEGPMTREQAYEILGLQPGASDQEIRAAHRRLMQKVHPDKGGSNFLAAKINEAKSLLLDD